MKQTSKLKMRRARFIFIMVLPAILFPMIFTYYPMIKGSLMAFQSYNLMNVKNIKWVGLENFSKLFAHNTSNTFYSTMLNTVKWFQPLSGADFLSMGCFGIYYRHHVALDVQRNLRGYQ